MSDKSVSVFIEVMDERFGPREYRFQGPECGGGDSHIDGLAKKMQSRLRHIENLPSFPFTNKDKFSGEYYRAFNKDELDFLRERLRDYCADI